MPTLTVLGSSSSLRASLLSSPLISTNTFQPSSAIASDGGDGKMILAYKLRTLFSLGVSLKFSSSRADVFLKNRLSDVEKAFLMKTCSLNDNLYFLLSFPRHFGLSRLVGSLLICNSYALIIVAAYYSSKHTHRFQPSVGAAWKLGRQICSTVGTIFGNRQVW